LLPLDAQTFDLISQNLLWLGLLIVIPEGKNPLVLLISMKNDLEAGCTQKSDAVLPSPRGDPAGLFG
jgi:hypothetical protein